MTTMPALKRIILDYWYNNSLNTGISQQSLYWNILSGNPETWTSTTEGYHRPSSTYTRPPFSYLFGYDVGGLWDWSASNESNDFKNPTENSITYGYIGFFNSSTRAANSTDYFNSLQFYTPFTIYLNTPEGVIPENLTIPPTGDFGSFEAINAENTLYFGNYP